MRQEWSAYIPFEDKSPSYTHGFEAGMIYQSMLIGGVIDCLLHVENRGQIETMAEKCGYHVSMDTLGDGWLQLTGVKVDYSLKRIK